MNVVRDALPTTERYLRDVARVHVMETVRRREWEL
jgi:hypothetical protein